VSVSVDTATSGLATHVVRMHSPLTVRSGWGSARASGSACADLLRHRRFRLGGGPLGLTPTQKGRAAPCPPHSELAALRASPAWGILVRIRSSASGSSPSVALRLTPSLRQPTDTGSEARYPRASSQAFPSGPWIPPRASPWTPRKPARLPRSRRRRVRQRLRPNNSFKNLSVYVKASLLHRRLRLTTKRSSSRPVQRFSTCLAAECASGGGSGTESSDYVDGFPSPHRDSAASCASGSVDAHSDSTDCTAHSDRQRPRRSLRSYGPSTT